MEIIASTEHTPGKAFRSTGAESAGGLRLSTESSHLVIVDYADDAERKRAEYLLDNWDGGTVRSVDGLARLLDDVEVDDLYEELVAKVPKEHIRVYELDAVEGDVSPTKTEIDARLETDIDRVEWAIESLLNKRKAVTEDAEHNVYGVYTKKGRATVEYELDAQDDEVLLHIRISGYGEAPEFLREFFEDELQYML